MKKRLFCFILIIALMLIGSIPICNLKSLKAEETKTIDIYLVAGQSNAVGYTYCASKTGETYNNIMFAGEIEESFLQDNGTVRRSNLDSFSSYKQSVTLGLGADSNYMGPEYGMASVLNDSYDSDNKALIFKYAAGGTSLLDNTQEYSSQFGNWYPSSLWEDDYVPNIENCYAGNRATGLLYYAFIKNFEKVYNELTSKGYTPVVKGMAWMQGCTNTYPSSSFSEYKAVLKEFIKSVRNDIYKITNNIEDKSMAFVIGKIATSFGAWNNSGAIAIDEIQQEVADEMDSKVECIETSDLILVNEQGVTVGTDAYHFNYNDDITLGKRFAQKICDITGKEVTTVYCNNGSYQISTEGDDRVISVKGLDHYYLTKFDINGEDKLSTVVNGKATLPTGKTTIVDIDFSIKELFNITYNIETNKGGGIQLQPKTCYDGETLSLKVYLNDNCKIKELSFDGTDFIYNNSTKTYEIEVNKSGVVKLIIENENKTDNNSQQEQPTEDTEEGCGSVIEISYLMVLTIFIGIFTILKKRKLNY